MTNFTDQHGQPLDRDTFITQISEAILANVIASVEAGISRDAVNVVVGPDGGTVTGGGVAFQTPVARRLSDDDAHTLHAAVAALLDGYDAGRVSASRLAAIRARHRVAEKTKAIQDAKAGKA